MDLRLYAPGEVIGQQFEIIRLIGQGGCGVVYLCRNVEIDRIVALKTFRDDLLTDLGARQRFAKEASIWVALGWHPHLVRAFSVIEIRGRLHIEMEYVEPDECGVNSIDGHLQHGPVPLRRCLRWAIQLCHALEYARSRGVRCHRDIKPSNILIGQDDAVRVSDFGLAGFQKYSSGASSVPPPGKAGPVRTIEAAAGTPAYMPPEQFIDASTCDERSDVYSFGVVLYQTQAGGALPFDVRAEVPERALRLWYDQHRAAAIEQLESPLWPIIARCLAKRPEQRYPTFTHLREDLATLLKDATGQVIRAPDVQRTDGYEWNAKGLSLANLGRYEEALAAYDEAMLKGADLGIVLSNKSISLTHLKRYGEAVTCADHAIALDPAKAPAWLCKGNSLHHLNRFDEAIRCYDEAIRLMPGRAFAWNNRGMTLRQLGRYDEALKSYREATDLDPGYAEAWSNQGVVLAFLNRLDDARTCYARAVAIAPLLAQAWFNLGGIEESLCHWDAAADAYRRYLDLNEGRDELNAKYASARLIALASATTQTRDTFRRTGAAPESVRTRASRQSPSVGFWARLRTKLLGVSPRPAPRIRDGGAEVRRQNERLLHGAEAGNVEEVECALAADAATGCRGADRKTPLHFAAEGGHLQIARVLLRHGADVSLRDDYSWTPVDRAVVAEQADVLRLFLSQGVNVNEVRESAGTRLCLAATQGKLKAAQVLLEHGADPNRCAPLQLACMSGHRDVVRLLLESGADPNLGEGVMPLHTAAGGCRADTCDIIRLLLDHGAEINATNREGSTPLHYALGNEQATVLLISRGAHVDIWCAAGGADHGGVLQMLAANQKLVDARGPNEMTPLHFAARYGQEKISSILLDRGALVNAQDVKGQTPLHCASESGHLRVVALLLQRGADPNARTRIAHGTEQQIAFRRKYFREGKTALHMAATEGHLPIVDLLLKHGADPAARDDNGFTPVQFAEVRRHKAVVDALHRGH